MENFKFIIFTIIVLIIIGSIGYWAFSTIETGAEYINKEKIENKKEKKDIKKEEDTIKEESNNKLEENTENEIKEEQKEILKKEEKKEITSYKYQDLINEIQKLINNKINIKKGDKGIQVGTVQKFLNIYNETSNKIDNDYGTKLETMIKEFQKEVKLTANGKVENTTYNKMIEWLKKQ